jgi:hypothetical protein
MSFGGDAGEFAARCGVHSRTRSRSSVEAAGVARDVIGVVQVLADDDVHHGERQRGVAAGIDEEMLVGGRAGAVAVRIDGVELRAVAPRFHDERPQVDVGAENVGAPGDDQLGVAELLGLGAVADAQRFVMPAMPAVEQMVRSRRDAPRRWKKRRSMPEPLSRPMVPA